MKLIDIATKIASNTSNSKLIQILDMRACGLSGLENSFKDNIFKVKKASRLPWSNNKEFQFLNERGFFIQSDWFSKGYVRWVE